MITLGKWPSSLRESWKKLVKSWWPPKQIWGLTYRLNAGSEGVRLSRTTKA